MWIVVCITICVPLNSLICILLSPFYFIIFIVGYYFVLEVCFQYLLFHHRTRNGPNCAAILHVAFYQLSPSIQLAFYLTTAIKFAQQEQSIGADDERKKVL